jgi:DNA-binding winged helix-turn-helix (wHTH) protein
MAALRKAIAGFGAGGEFILTVPRIGSAFSPAKKSPARRM